MNNELVSTNLITQESIEKEFVVYRMIEEQVCEFSNRIERYDEYYILEGMHGKKWRFFFEEQARLWGIDKNQLPYHSRFQYIPNEILIPYFKLIEHKHIPERYIPKERILYSRKFKDGTKIIIYGYFFKESVISLLIQKKLDDKLVLFFQKLVENSGGVPFDDYIDNWCDKLLKEPKGDEHELDNHN